MQPNVKMAQFQTSRARCSIIGPLMDQSHINLQVRWRPWHFPTHSRKARLPHVWLLTATKPALSPRVREENLTQQSIGQQIHTGERKLECAVAIVYQCVLYLGVCSHLRLVVYWPPSHPLIGSRRRPELITAHREMARISPTWKWVSGQIKNQTLAWVEISHRCVYISD